MHSHTAFTSVPATEVVAAAIVKNYSLAAIAAESSGESFGSLLL